MSINAFPASFEDGAYQNGMTLRDWFAGQALAGLAANADYAYVTVEQLADSAYGCADAMLAEREMPIKTPARREDGTSAGGSQ